MFICTSLINLSIPHREDYPKTYNQKYEDNGDHNDTSAVVVSNPLSQPIPWHMYLQATEVVPLVVALQCWHY